ncbi:MAG TPA: transketolase C-terminal domain-containing protein [Candidatus Dormibacteraeota bacterium]|nr:transketolase C-terminal domain-containing protein [Candidatus Dormibacteraeota bacterium]
MRQAFAETLTRLADRDERILLLTGDLGFMALEPFAEAHPSRFYNVGVAEQNMIGLATGLAEGGAIPFVYSIVTFALLRPYEFIRNGPILHQWPVRIVGIGGGFEYGSAGYSHHGLEDIAVARVHPDLTVVAPADHEQTRAALLATWDLPGPIYYRLGKDDVTTVAGLDGRFELARAQEIRHGGDVVILTTGSVAVEATAAADLLEPLGIRATVIVVASINPPPVADIARALAGMRLAVTVEAHYVTGGLGSLVCEVVAQHGLACRVVRCGVATTPRGRTGSAAYFHTVHGLTRTLVAQTVQDALRGT